MRILLLTTHMNLGGIGMYVLSLAKGLAQTGHQVWVVSSGGDLIAPLESFGARHVALDIQTKSAISPKVFLARKKIIQLIGEKDIEIIHAHTRVTQVLAHLVSRQSAVPYVTTGHGFFKPKFLRKTFSCWGDYCIAVSEAVREHLVNDFKFRKEKISVVHNGVETERFSPDKFSQEQRDGFRRNYGLKLNVPIIGTVARLSSVKGQRYLIAAMKIILKTFPQAQLLLVGDGPEKTGLRRQVRELGIAGHVFFAPSTLDTTVPLSIMDVFAFPSLSEGLGLAIIEAQAMALPVVASDVGGVYTLVKEGISGSLVPPRQPGELARAVLSYLQNRDLGREAGQRGRRRALREFNLERMIKGVEAVYGKVLKK